MKNNMMFLIVFLHLTSYSIGQNLSNTYNILFRQDCSYLDAKNILIDLCGSIAEKKALSEFEIIDERFNLGKIAFNLDPKPSSQQIDKLFEESSKLASLELIRNRVMYRDFYESLKNKKTKYMSQSIHPDYRLVLIYDFNAIPKDEVKLLKEIFGENNYLFEKEANELSISIPKKYSNKFLELLGNNKLVVSIRKK